MVMVGLDKLFAKLYVNSQGQAVSAVSKEQMQANFEKKRAEFTTDEQQVIERFLQGEVTTVAAGGLKLGFFDYAAAQDQGKPNGDPATLSKDELKTFATNFPDAAGHDLNGKLDLLDTNPMHPGMIAELIRRRGESINPLNQGLQDLNQNLQRLPLPKAP